jgi:heme/copper-type cytochrome/quinol oxidase subunit 3
LADITLPATAAPVAHEAGHVEHGPVDSHGTTGLSNNKLAMWLFLGSDCLLFGGLISTYMLYRGRTQNGPKPDQL